MAWRDHLGREGNQDHRVKWVILDHRVCQDCQDQRVSQEISGCRARMEVKVQRARLQREAQQDHLDQKARRELKDRLGQRGTWGLLAGQVGKATPERMGLKALRASRETWATLGRSENWAPKGCRDRRDLLAFSEKREIVEILDLWGYLARRDLWVTWDHQEPPVHSAQRVSPVLLDKEGLLGYRV